MSFVGTRPSTQVIVRSVLIGQVCPITVLTIVGLGILICMLIGCVIKKFDCSPVAKLNSWNTGFCRLVLLHLNAIYFRLGSTLETPFSEYLILSDIDCRKLYTCTLNCSHYIYIVLIIMLRRPLLSWISTWLLFSELINQYLIYFQVREKISTAFYILIACGMYERILKIFRRPSS